MDDRIERQIMIQASLDRVWDLVTQPGWWVPSDNEVAVDRTPGHQTVRESAQWGRFPIEVVRIDPQTYAAFRWASQFAGEELAPGKTTLVEFLVAPVEDGVSVTVTESGFATLDATEDVRRSGYEGNTKGWKLELEGLRTRAEQTSAA